MLSDVFKYWSFKYQTFLYIKPLKYQLLLYFYRGSFWDIEPPKVVFHAVTQPVSIAFLASVAFISHRHGQEIDFFTHTSICYCILEVTWNDTLIKFIICFIIYIYSKNFVTLRMYIWMYLSERCYLSVIDIPGSKCRQVMQVKIKFCFS